MLNKYGVNSIRAEKKGPLVKDGIKRKVEKTIVCACGKKFVKDCPSETLCELSSFFCPYCGAEIK
jgi:hypothetical protein